MTGPEDFGHSLCMTQLRSSASALAIAIVSALAITLASCSSSTSAPAGDGGTSGAATPPPDGGGGAVGDPCVPKQEDDARFLGFADNEVNIETKSPSCASSVCLVNHFRGRVSCPYGQTVDGAAPSGAQACTTPDTHAAVTGGEDPTKKAQVLAQCVDRTADKTVYCSCRCANADGMTNDGFPYCTCGDGLTCAPLVSSIGSDPDNLAGSYCIKANTAYDKSTSCTAGSCDPSTRACK